MSKGFSVLVLMGYWVRYQPSEPIIAHKLRPCGALTGFNVHLLIIANNFPIYSKQYFTFRAGTPVYLTYLHFADEDQKKHTARLVPNRSPYSSFLFMIRMDIFAPKPKNLAMQLLLPAETLKLSERYHPWQNLFFFLHNFLYYVQYIRPVNLPLMFSENCKKRERLIACLQNFKLPP